MNPNYVTRKLESTDWQILKQIRLEALQKEASAFGSDFNDYVDQSDAYWQELLSNHELHYWVAFADNLPVGMVRIRINDPETPVGLVYLGSLYVNAEYRGQGIAKALIEQVEDFAKQLPDVKGCYIEVYKSQQSAVSLYTKLNYRLVKTQNTDGREDSVMEKRF